MDFQENYSTLSVNNSFYKTFKIINDKKLKNESTIKEIEWIQSKLHQNPKFCENSVNVILRLNDFGFAMNTLVSILPIVSEDCFQIVADGIFKLLLIDVNSKNYKSPFGISTKPHPLLLLVDDSNEKLLYLSMKIVGVLKSSNR